LSIEDWDWDILPENDKQVWDSLLYPIFLGATVRSAQASYIKQVLGRFIGLDVAPAVRVDPNWSKNVLKIIEQEKNAILGTPGEGLKRSILNLISQEVADLNLSRTIDTALSFFDRNNIGVEIIKRLENNTAETKELIAYASRDIYNVSYIKAVLWLYSCGIARELVPPNAHIIRFLDECGYPGFGWSRDGYPPDWQIFSIVCDKMQEVAQQVSFDLKQEISPKQAQAAVWYLQTCRGLLPRKYARRLTPRKLTSFLEYMGWRIKNLEGVLSDVEQLDSLTVNLKEFIEHTRNI